MELLETIQDNRKLLIERIPVALALHNDQSVVFPARHQYLLDWLLEGFFRILKLGPPRTKEIINMVAFWKLLDQLLGGEDKVKIVSSRKRQLLPQVVSINKPLLPIFSTFLLNFDSNNLELDECNRLVIECMQQSISREEVLGRASIRCVHDLLIAVTTGELKIGTFEQSILGEVAKLLVLWFNRQNSRRKAYMELSELVFQFLTRLEDTLLIDKVMQRVILCPDIIDDIVKELKDFEARSLPDDPLSLPILGKVLAANIDPVTYLRNYVITAKEKLSSVEFRSSVASLFKTFLPRDNMALKTEAMIEVLKSSGIASVQSDPAWELCRVTLDKLVITFLKDPKVLQSILNVDMSIITPHLEKIFASFKEDGDWHLFMSTLGYSMSNSRQMDIFIETMVKNTFKDPISMEFLLELRPLLVNLHNIMAKQIIQSLLGTTGNGVIMALRWLRVFTTTHLSLMQKVAGKVIILCRDHSDATRKESFLLLESILEQASLDDHLDSIKSLSHENPDQVELALILAIRGQGDFPNDLSKLPESTKLVKYLPPLLMMMGVVDCEIPPLKRNSLPPWVLQTAMFWEALPSIDWLLLPNLDDPYFLLELVESLPEEGLVPNDKDTVIQCLGAFDAANLLGSPGIAKILNLVDVQLPETLVNRLFANGTGRVRLILFKNGLVSLDYVLKYASKSLTNMLNVLEIFNLLKERIDTETQDDDSNEEGGDKGVQEEVQSFDIISDEQKLELARCFCQGEVREQVEYYRLAAILFKLDILKSTQVVKPLFNKSQEWKFTVALYESGQRSKADIDVIMAIEHFMKDDSIEAKDLSRFFQGEGGGGGANIEEMEKVIELIEKLPIGERLLCLLNILLIQSLEIQSLVCPFFDKILVSPSAKATIESNEKLWIQLLSRRANCGGPNIEAFQRDLVFDTALEILSMITAKVPPYNICKLLTILFQSHWVALMHRRPPLIALLCILQNVAPARTYSRILKDFTSHRQADQHFYILPLLLSYSQLLDGPRGQILKSSCCELVRHLETYTPPLDKRVKFFQADPFERLMHLAPSDDARVILRSLINFYRKEVKYTGKA